MEKEPRIYYDQKYDRLMIAGKKDSDIMSGSVRILNVILDFNTENKAVNAELLHASEYIESLGLDPEILGNITGGGLSFRQLKNGYEIIFILKLGQKVIPISYNVQLPTQKQIIITSA